MKKTIVSALVLVCCSAQMAMSQVSVQMDVSAAKNTINRNIYGHFAEHLGRCIYGGFYVGDTSSIPNTNGVRNDVVDALRKLKIPNLRWPGWLFCRYLSLERWHWPKGQASKNRKCLVGWCH